MWTTRRRFAACLGATFAALAGCSWPAGVRGTETRISEITIQNTHDEPHVFHVLVLADGDPLLWRSSRVSEAEYDGDRLKAAAATTWPNPVSDPGEYVIHARLDDNEEWKRVATADLDGPCVRFEVEVERDGRLQIEFASCS